MMADDIRLVYAVFCDKVIPKNVPPFDIVNALPKIDKTYNKYPQRPDVVHFSTRLILGIVGVKKDKKHKLLLNIQTPSGLKEGPITTQVFNGSNDIHGMLNLTVDLQFDITEDGLYSFSVLIDGSPLVELSLPVRIRIVGK